MKVDFIIVGAQKCATTTLFKILAHHPGIVGARVKEPHFFSTSPDWRRELPQYEALFDEQEEALYGEASTSYTFYPHRNLDIWEDIFAYNPAMKFIYLVRSPIDRILSDYMHRVARGYTDQPIERLILRHPLVLDATRYYTQIMPYIRRFGRDRVLLIEFEDFMQHRRATLERVTRFLGVPLEGLGDFETVHANKSIGGRKRHHRFDHPSLVLRGVRKLMPGVWERIVDRFSPDVTERPHLAVSFKRMILHVLDLEIRALEDLMEKDLGHWRCVEAAPPRTSSTESEHSRQGAIP